MLPLTCCFSLLLLVCDLSYAVASLQLSSSPDTNGSYCPGNVNFTCVGTDVPIGVGWRVNGAVIEAYTYTFGNQGNEMFPEVEFMDDNVTITVENAVITSMSTHNITVNLSTNMFYSTLRCRTATQESDFYVVLPRDPEIPNNITVDPVYNLRTKTLSQINVFWNTSNEVCMNYLYQVMLTNGSISLQSENITCIRNTECRFTFTITSEMFERYVVQVVTLNFQGLAVNTSILPPVDYISSILPNISVEFLSCFIRCNSDSNVIGTCVIEFPEGLVSGTVNSGDIQLPESLQSETVNYNATFNIDGNTYTFNDSDEVQYNRKWTAGILTYAILTPVLCFLSVILIILLGVGWYKRKADLKKCWGYPVILTCTLLPSIIFLLASLCCWIAGLVDVSKTDDCNSVDQPQSILTAACIFSALSIIFDVTAIVLVHIYNSLTKKKPQPTFSLAQPESWQTKKGVKNWQTDELGMLVDEKGERVVEVDVVTSGHRGFGEKTTDARSRVAEEHTREAKMLMLELKKEESVLKSETESNLYSQTEHVGPSSNQKKKPKQESNYSSMGKKPAVSPGDKHYAKLQHNNSASVPPAGPSPSVFVTSTASGGSMPLSTPAGYSQVGAQPLDLPPNVSRANAEKSGSNPEYGKLELQEKNEQESTAKNGRRKAEENKKKNDTFTAQET